NYTSGDADARFKRMQGFNVLHPIGWDSFGLPAENAAIKHGIPPRDWTNANIQELKRACRRFGFSYDWEREISTCEPEYYRWNQWFFLRMFERGLAYRKPSRVNWCPQCQTVLANEQAENGFCWRHEDTRVEAREIEQWFLKTTAYSEQLLEDIAQLEGGWPERVLVMQRNWIGKSKGARVKFAVDGAAGAAIEVFTTRIDTIYGATAVIVAPEHPLLAPLLDGAEKGILDGLNRLRQQHVREADLATAEKEGVFTGRYAVNPFNGEKLPIWAANFVLLGYGTGAVMCVPAHDQRDFEFCRKYELPVRVVVQNAESDLVSEEMGEAYSEYGRSVNSGPYSGLPSAEAIEKMTADSEARGFGVGQTIFRLKDWGISRQRFWGTPIPMIHCGVCGVVPVPDEQLPVLLPKNVELTGMGESPLARVPTFVNTTCPKCGKPARRETDTMDTFMDSSWYFYRYADPRNDKAPFDPKVVGYWFQIDQYIGGIVHAILHLMYSRFFCKVMRDLGLVTHDEPVKRLFCQGTVLKGGTAMSKSSGNVVAAMEMAEKFGCDTARLYTLFAAPPEKDMEWSEQSVEGCSRFLHRVFRLLDKHAARLRDVHAAGASLDLATASEKEKALLRKAHQTLKRVTKDLEIRWHFNSSIALLMELVNELHAAEPLTQDARPEVIKEVMQMLVLMMGPYTPHLSEELWEILGNTGGLGKVRWPAYREDLAREEQHEVVVQVNGRVRSRIYVESGLSEEELVARAIADPKVAPLVNGKRVVKRIVVPEKLVNIVVAE
ncbi:MAG: leucine--tRNA ligase, partial [Acidobacteria bacterium]|nr:leucine--tRNA ligase [Acidobacteriota bacterium]